MNIMVVVEVVEARGSGRLEGQAPRGGIFGEVRWREEFWWVQVKVDNPFWWVQVKFDTPFWREGPPTRLAHAPSARTLPYPYPFSFAYNTISTDINLLIPSNQKSHHMTISMIGFQNTMRNAQIIETEEKKSSSATKRRRRTGRSYTAS